LFFDVLFGNAGPHPFLQIDLLGRAFADVGSTETAYFRAAAWRTGCVPITQRTPRRAAAEIFPLKGLARCPRRHGSLR
jgi:hypothetical protein